MDEVLISQYSNFKELGTKGCFELLSALLPGTTAKQCYKRGKQLGLKKKSEDELRAYSKVLISAQSEGFISHKFSIAFKNFILSRFLKRND